MDGIVYDRDARDQFFVSVSGSGRDLDISKSRVEIRDRNLKISRDSGKDSIYLKYHVQIQYFSNGNRF